MRSIGNRCLGTTAPDALALETWAPAFAGETVECADTGHLYDVFHALDAVLDPELDEPVTALGFVTRVAVDGDAVSVGFRLPTYWCSPNFAWIMAEDMRDALRALPWARQVTVTLADHLFAAKINASVNRGKGFDEAFAEAGGDLAQLRAVFRRKAYLGRMAALIEALRADGRSDAALMAMTVGDLRQIVGPGNDPLPTSFLQGEGTQDEPITGQLGRSWGSDGGVTPPPPVWGRMGGGQGHLPSLADRYLELRTVFGGRNDDSDRAFRTPEGEDIASSALPLFLRGIRMTRRGVEANGEMCRIYLRERPAGQSETSRMPAPAGPLPLNPPAPASSGR